MIRTLTRSLLLLFASVLGLSATASHVSGVDITYNCLGNDQYEIFFTLYRDCSGISEPSTVTLDITSTCGQSFTVTLDSLPIAQWPDPLPANEISQLCPTDLPNSTCNGGLLPGMEQFVYSGIVTLTPPCNTWTISWDLCCRNSSVNVPNSDADDMYVETTLNTVTAPCNNSAQITAQPIPYVCNNQPVVYSYGAFDVDGDSLVYSLISGREANTTNLVYGPGFSATQPIPGITLDPNTGTVTFTPTVTGNYIVVVQVAEYDSNGNLIGTVMRDMQFTVINCLNTVPPAPVTMNNFSGTGIQTGPLSVELCVGNDFCLDLVFTDPDVGDTLTLTSNVDNVLPGATFVQNGVNPATATICWTATTGTASLASFNVQAEDDACPVTGITQQSIQVSVIPSTWAGPDQTICGNQTASISAVGGSIFNWTAISGDPIVVGTNFSCNPCQNPVAQPSQTTTYVVVSNLTGTCVNTDTITINVVPDFNYTVTQSAPSSCLLEDIQLNAAPNPFQPGYTFTWDPPTFLSGTNIPDPLFTATQAGTFGYEVTMTSPQGCVKVDSAFVTVAPAYSPNITALISDTMIACLDSVYLDVDMGTIIPVQCGLSQTGCSGPQSQVTIGTGQGANTPTTYPAPYGNWYTGARHQILYTAAELQAMGFFGGQITELAFNIQSIPAGAITVYQNFEIRMTCTNLTQLTSTGGWVTGANVVFPAQTVNIAPGWNTHTFANAFDWDGVSNVVVEVCFDLYNGGSSWTDNAITFWTPTPLPSVLYFRSDAGNVCYGGTPTQSTNRPNTRFTVCGGGAQPGQFSFDWTPTTWLDDPTIQNPSAQPLFPMTYTVTVTNNLGGCTDTDSVFVFVNCGLCFPPTPEVHNVTCHGGSDGWIAAEPFGIEGPPWIYRWYDANNNLLQTTTTNGNDTLAGLPAGTYTIHLQDTTGCWDDTTVVITEPDPILVATSDTTICLSTNATLAAQATGGNGGYTYTWDQGLVGNGPHSVGPLVDTDYIVFATDSLGCMSEPDTATVLLNPPLQVIASGPDSICEFADAELQAVAAGGDGGPYTFSWSGNGMAVGQGTPLTVTPNVPQTLYIVELTDACGSPAAFDSVTVNWYPAPDVIFSADPLEDCFPAVIDFTNGTDPADVGADCIWDFGDGTTGTGCAGITHSYGQVGCYDVTLTVFSPEGCPGDTTYVQYVCARPYPSADFTFTPPTTNIFQTDIAFNNLSVGGQTFEWFFGENAEVGSSNEVNPVITFPDADAGEYPVWLYVTNEFGCMDSVMRLVIIDDVFLFYVPNSFTPDGDGVNELFGPLGEGYSLENYEMLIFDRWGQVVYETDNISKWWDGTINGTPAMQGVYAWKIVVSDDDSGDRREYLGHVTLLR